MMSLAHDMSARVNIFMWYHTRIVVIYVMAGGANRGWHK